MSSSANRLWQLLRPYIVLNDHKRPFGFLLMACLSVGTPVALGLLLGDFSAGILAAMGGLASIYFRQTSVSHRFFSMLLVSFGFCLSFAITLYVGHDIQLLCITLGIIAFCATFISRILSMPPPGSFFFILIACIASAMPYDVSLIIEKVFLLFLGCLSACTYALIYTLYQYFKGDIYSNRHHQIQATNVIAITLEALTIAIFIVLSYVLALMLGVDKPYWVAISCAAILQGASFREVKHRNIHRIVGTLLGMGVTWCVFYFTPTPWMLALLIPCLSLVIEILVTRNYGLAVIFITPLTIIFAEAKQVSLDTNALIILRLQDVILGSLLGVLGGWVLHHKHFYYAIERRLSRMFTR